MIDAIANAAVEPFMHTIGWQAFAYGVAGKLVLKKAKHFIHGWRTPDTQGSAARQGEQQPEKESE